MKKLLLTISLLCVPPSFSAAAAQTIGTARTLDITVQNTGQTLTVKAGDILRFSLSTSPGTGYSWHALEVDPEYLVLVDRTTAAPPPLKPGQAPLVGGPGPAVVYVYYVRKSLNLGSYSVTSPIIFASVPPGRSGEQNTRLVQFNLTSR